MEERLSFEQAIARYSDWIIYDSNGSHRWLLGDPEDLSKAVHLIVEGDWVTVCPVILSPGLGLKPQGRWKDRWEPGVKV